MSIYRFDLEDSKEDGIVLVTLSGRAQAETIVKLLDELNALAERDSSLRVLIDETNLGAGLSAQAISAGSPRRGGQPRPSARFVSLRSPPTRSSTASTRMFQGLADGAERVSVFNDRAIARAWLLES